VSEETPIPPLSFWMRSALLVLARPWLWATAARQILRLARYDWWRRAPFLPLPDAGYLRFRFETQYGTGPGARADPADVIVYLEWCRELAANGHRARRERR
jgi:hypothetical protein